MTHSVFILNILNFKGIIPVTPSLFKNNNNVDDFAKCDIADERAVGKWMEIFRVIRGGSNQIM